MWGKRDDWNNWWQVSSKKHHIWRKTVTITTAHQLNYKYHKVIVIVTSLSIVRVSLLRHIFEISLSSIQEILTFYFKLIFDTIFILLSQRFSQRILLSGVFSLPTWKTKPLVCGRRTHSVGSTTTEEATKHNWQPKSCQSTLCQLSLEPDLVIYLLDIEKTSVTFKIYLWLFP